MLRLLANGALVEVIDSGKAVKVICDWLVSVPSRNPEPSCEADCWTEVECGARVRVHGAYPDAELGDALTCENGHDRLSMEIAYGTPFGPGWEWEEAERLEETGRYR